MRFNIVLIAIGIIIWVGSILLAFRIDKIAKNSKEKKGRGTQNK